MASQEFYYLIEELRKIVSLETVYALDSQEEGKAGPVLTDRHILGEDEAVFFRRLLKTAAGVVYKRIHRRGRGVTDAYQFDVEREEVPGYLIFTLSFPDNFDTNLFDAIDTQISNTLMNHVLMGWFAKYRRNFRDKDFAELYKNSIDELKSLLEMRTSTNRRSIWWGRYYVEEEDE